MHELDCQPSVVAASESGDMHAEYESEVMREPYPSRRKIGFDPYGLDRIDRQDNNLNQSLDKDVMWLTEKVAAAVRDLGQRIGELQEQRFVETIDIERISQSIVDLKSNGGSRPEDHEGMFGTEYQSKRARKRDA
jgi:hypothetical protein